MENLINKNKLTQFMEDMDCDQKLFDELMAYFSSFIDDFKGLKLHDDEETLRNFELHAHKLKSSCDNFGADQLRDCLFEVEKSGRDRNFEEVAHHYNLALVLMDPTLVQLKNFGENYFVGEGN